MTGANFTSATGTPASPTVTVGINAAVTWTNGSLTEHDVTFDTPLAALGVGGGAGGNIGPHTSGSNQRRFATVDSYPFHCMIHGPSMSGTVIVQ